MEKLTEKHRLRHIRLSRYAVEKAIKRNQLRIGTSKSKKRLRNIKFHRAPTTFCVRWVDSRNILLNFVKKVEADLASGAIVSIIFDDTKQLLPCGTLLFASKIDIWVQKHPGKLRARGQPKDEVVAQLFKKMGILESLGIDCNIEPNHERVKYWHYLTGDSVSAIDYKPLARDAARMIDHPEGELFADCLNEAVTNTVNHAYKHDTGKLPPRNKRNWWMFSSLTDNRFFVAIYDAGVSIPFSLEKAPEWKDAIRSLHKKDGRLIKTAVTGPRTSTSLGNRGKGLPEMLEFSQQLKDGALMILSRRGSFAYLAARKKPQQILSYESSLPGTLVLWEIPILPSSDK